MTRPLSVPVCRYALLAAALTATGCTGTGAVAPRPGAVSATFVSGTPGTPSVESGEEPSASCVAIDPGGTTTLLLRVSGSDPNGLDHLAIVGGRRTGTWQPSARLGTAEPAARLVTGGGEVRVAFPESPPAGEVQISALAEVEVEVTPNDTDFDNPAWLRFRAVDVRGDATETAGVDLRRHLDPPPATTTGVFVCMNGTAR